MSRIDDLLAELAPQGVLYFSLGQVAAYSTTRVDGSLLDSSSFVGVDNLLAERRGKTAATHSPNTSALTAYEIGDVLLGNIRPYLKKIWLADDFGGCSGDVLAIRISARFGERLYARFLYYVLASDKFFDFNTRHARGAKMPRGDKAAILQFRVPVPPLEVQREIVRVLDQFSQLETELEAELEAELNLRRQQYSHHAGVLTAPGAGDRQVTLGEVAVIARGASPRPIQNFMTDDPDGAPWIKIGDVPVAGKYITKTRQRVTRAGAQKSRRVVPGDFILSNSMSFGRPYISQIDGYIHDGWLAISGFERDFLPDYLYYLLRSAPVQKQFQQRAGSGTVQNLNADIVKSVRVPLPSRELQEQVVSLLDRFDRLVNGLVDGLPAELAARRQQYEYYRDKLLTFEEAPA